jgi:hypothetical protein
MCICMYIYIYMCVFMPEILDINSHFIGKLKRVEG